MTRPATIARAGLSPSERRLFACLGGDEPAAGLDELSEEGWRSLTDLAARMMVEPLLCHRLLAPGVRHLIPEHARARLVEGQRNAAIAALRMHADLRRVVQALHDHDIPVVVLKGPHLAGAVYGNVSMRTARDLDLLVRRCDLAETTATLPRLGYEPSAPFRLGSGALPYSWHHLPPFRKPGATTVEVHWHIVGPQSTAVVDVEHLWDRAVRERIAGLDVLVLSPEDLLLHLCVHATCQHLCECAARSWCDIAEVVRKHGASLSWNDVVGRATRWRCRRGTYLALRLARDLANADVPEEVIRTLRPLAEDSRVLLAAMRQRHRVRMSGGMAELHDAGMAARLRTVWNRVSVPAREIADRYDVPRTARYLPALYAIRLRDLGVRHWRSAVRLLRSDAATASHARDTAMLSAFLAVE